MITSTQWLQNNCGWLIAMAGVTWPNLRGLVATDVHFSMQKPYNQKNTHLEFVNNPPRRDQRPTVTRSGNAITINNV